MRISFFVLAFILVTSSLFAQQNQVLFQENYVCNADEKTTHSRDFIFQYSKMDADSILIEVLLSSGIKEGKLQNVKILTDEFEYTLDLFDIESNETVVEKTSTHSYTEQQYQTVNDPGGFETIVQPDGTHKTINRPPSTKTVLAPVERTATNTRNKIVRLNKFKSSLNKMAIEDIINSYTFEYEFEFEYQKLVLLPSRIDKKELKVLFKN